MTFTDKRQAERAQEAEARTFQLRIDTPYAGQARLRPFATLTGTGLPPTRRCAGQARLRPFATLTGRRLPPTRRDAGQARLVIDAEGRP